MNVLELSILVQILGMLAHVALILGLYPYVKRQRIKGRETILSVLGDSTATSALEDRVISRLKETLGNSGTGQMMASARWAKEAQKQAVRDATAAKLTAFLTEKFGMVQAGVARTFLEHMDLWDRALDAGERWPLIVQPVMDALNKHIGAKVEKATTYDPRRLGLDG